MNLHQLYEGWRNNIIPPAQLKKKIEAVSAQRMALCRQCDFHSNFHGTIRPDEHCTKCGCTLSAKTRCMSCKCPLEDPEWEAVITEAVETKIKEKIK